MGMTDDGMAALGEDPEVAGSGFSVDSMSDVGSGDNAGSAGEQNTGTSVSTASLSHDLSDHSGFKHKGHFHHPLESRYSDTNSENLHGDT